MNVKLSNSQLNKLKSAIKNETEAALRLSSNMIGNSNDETNFPHKLLLTNRQVTNLRKAFANHTSADIKLPKTQLSEMIQSGGILGRLLDPLLKTELPLMKNVIQTLAKSVLIPSGLKAAASAASAASAANTGIHKKILGSGNNTALIISNGENMKMMKVVSETNKNEAKEQKGGFLSMLLGTLGASLLGKMLAGKGVMKAGQGTIRVGYRSKRSSLKDLRFKKFF